MQTNSIKCRPGIQCGFHESEYGMLYGFIAT